MALRGQASHGVEEFVTPLFAGGVTILVVAMPNANHTTHRVRNRVGSDFSL
jgi:hypothetical protein